MQIRKLEFLLAAAIDEGCDSVITFGGFSSNHSRAVVMAARELGLQPHVMVLSPTPEVNPAKQWSLCHPPLSPLSSLSLMHTGKAELSRELAVEQANWC